ncbi:hypothetical protein EDC96DRAFT_613000 [Choanephora cucurbitarum]|nr:hypothetical protein EDC96DRAFT_613000 [Choanephora cucurbitarum]
MPMPRDLDSTEQLYDARINYFLDQWLHDEASSGLTDMSLFHSVVIGHIIAIMEADNPHWALNSYSQLDMRLKQDALTSFRKLAKAKDIPTDRCDNFWLENMILGYLYRNRQQPKKTKLMEANKLIEIEAHNDDQQTSFATPSQQAYASEMDRQKIG